MNDSIHARKRKGTTARGRVETVGTGEPPPWDAQERSPAAATAPATRAPLRATATMGGRRETVPYVRARTA